MGYRNKFEDPEEYFGKLDLSFNNTVSKNVRDDKKGCSFDVDSKFLNLDKRVDFIRSDPVLFDPDVSQCFLDSFSSNANALENDTGIDIVVVDSNISFIQSKSKRAKKLSSELEFFELSTANKFDCLAYLKDNDLNYEMLGVESGCHDTTVKHLDKIVGSDKNFYARMTSSLDDGEHSNGANVVRESG